jgi:hypothetical protein
MPVIEHVGGVAIQICIREHGEPHFHAHEGKSRGNRTGREAEVSIIDGEEPYIRAGRLKRKDERAVLAYARDNHHYLLGKWYEFRPDDAQPGTPRPVDPSA